MADEQTVNAPAGDAAKTEAKKKKMNKLSLGEINSKIDELGKINQTQSKYYQHLLQRKNELSA